MLVEHFILFVLCCIGIRVSAKTPTAFTVAVPAGSFWPSGSPCLSDRRAPAPDAVKIRLVVRGWMSHKITTHVAKIVLEEMAGHPVELLRPLDENEYWYGSNVWSQLGAQEPLFDGDMEQWLIDQGINTDGYKLFFETTRSVEDLGTVGYYGRSGIFFSPPESLVQHPEFMLDFWRQWKIQEVQALTPPFSFWNLSDLFPDPSEYPCQNEPPPGTDEEGVHDWCQNNSYVPPQCQYPGSQCGTLVHCGSSFDRGRVEQLVKNNGLNLTIIYVGYENIQHMVQSAVDSGWVPLWYLWTPDSIVNKLGGTRVAFPTWSPGCDSERPNTTHPSGTIKCDFRIQTLTKLVNSKLRGLAPTAYIVLKRFRIAWSELKIMMDKHEDGDSNMSSLAVACEFVRANSDRLRQALVVTCPASLTVDPTDGSCAKLCPDGNACGSEFLNTGDDDSSIRFWVVFISAVLLFVVVFCFIAHFIRGRKKNLSCDSPDDINTPTGAWVAEWVGLRIQGCLRPDAANTMSPRNSRTMSPRSSRIMSVSRTISVSTTMSGKKKKFWLINASPFRVCLNQGTLLGPESFCIAFLSTSGSMHLEVLNSQDAEPWMNLAAESTSFTIEWNSGWTQRPGKEDCEHNQIEYNSPILRKPLPNSIEGNPLGEVKLVKGTRCALLIVWSPSHLFRGVPISEFERFLSEVIDHQSVWDCKGVIENDASALDTPGEHENLELKGPGSHRRNMHDACHHIIVKQMACFDASYAELLCAFGPADVFVSHVWSQTAFNTRAAIIKSDTIFKLHFSDRRRASIRLWFCTICNNQSRVHEELGDDVEKSPFARVLESEFCRFVVVISPLLALERKWCNFEFCFAKHKLKPVVLLTEEGSVQAGQVSPQALDNLSKKVLSFDCKDARCSSPHDEAFIDRAVEQMGGYQELNDDLMAVFHSAILDAHKWTTRALKRFSDPAEVDARFSL